MNEAPAPVAPAPIDIGAAGSTAPLYNLGELAAEQSAKTTAAFVANKGGRPKGARDSKPRKPRGVPVASMGLGSVPLPVDPLQTDFDPLGAPAPVVDAETLKAICEAGVEVFAEVRTQLLRLGALKITGDAVLADAFATPIPEKLRGIIEKGAFLVAQKYSFDPVWAPELMLGGGFVLLVGSDLIRLRKLRVAYQKVTADPLKAAA